MPSKKSVYHAAPSLTSEMYENDRVCLRDCVQHHYRENKNRHYSGTVFESCNEQETIRFKIALYVIVRAYNNSK
jgi:hypothetical protein